MQRFGNVGVPCLGVAVATAIHNIKPYNKTSNNWFWIYLHWFTDRVRQRHGTQPHYSLYLEVFSAMIYLSFSYWNFVMHGSVCDVISAQVIMYRVSQKYKMFQMLNWLYYANSRECLPHTQMHKAPYSCITQ